MTDREEVQKILDDVLSTMGIRSYYRRKGKTDRNADERFFVVYRRYLNYPVWHGDGKPQGREVGYDVSFCFEDSEETALKAEEIAAEIVCAFRAEGWQCENEGTDGGEAETGFWELRLSFSKEGIWSFANWTK